MQNFTTHGPDTDAGPALRSILAYWCRRFDEDKSSQVCSAGCADPHRVHVNLLPPLAGDDLGFMMFFWLLPI